MDNEKTFKPDWQPSWQVYPDEWEDGQWAKSITVYKWERNALGETRILETRRYILEDKK